MGLSWGIISTARINRHVLTGAAGSDAVDIVAVAGRDAARTEAYAREHRIPRAYAGYDALLADPEIEAVYVSLPNAMHVDWAIRALRAGKHVLCEKPLSRRAADVERAFDVAHEEGRLLMEAFMWRHNPQTTMLARLVADGRIGPLRLVRASFSFLLDDPANIRLSGELDGGALMDLGCYAVSGARLLAGEPETVTAQQVMGGSGTPSVDTRFAGVLRHAGGVLSTLDCGFDLAPGHRLEAIGTEGALVVADPWHCRTPGIAWHRADGQVETIAIDLADSYRLELENFTAAIRGDAIPLLGREDALGQARAIEALYASADAAGAATAVAR